MAKRKKSFKSNLRPDERFTQISRGYMKGVAWQDLSDCARVLLIYMRTLYNQHNNGQIDMSARYAGEVLNRAPTTAYRALVDLTKKGFIAPHKMGSIGLNGCGVATAWELTDFPVNGKPPRRLYQAYRSSMKESDPGRQKRRTTDRKKQYPVPSAEHSNSDLNILGANSVFDLNTGVCDLNTGKGVNGPSSVCELNTYIDHIPHPTHSFPNTNLEKSTNQVGQSHTDLAERIGSNGWEIVVGVSPETLKALTAKNDAGTLTEADISCAAKEAEKYCRELAS